MTTISLTFPYEQPVFDGNISFPCSVSRNLSIQSNVDSYGVFNNTNKIGTSYFIANGYGKINNYIPRLGYKIDAMFIENKRRLSYIAKLTDNWDGEGAHPIPSVCINIAKDILSNLSQQPIAAPTVCGTIMLQYIQRPDSIFTINVHPDRIEVFYMINHGGGGKRKEVFSPGKDAIKNIKIMVSEFFEHE